jgi:hypothetical protein
MFRPIHQIIHCSYALGILIDICGHGGTRDHFIPYLVTIHPHFHPFLVLSLMAFFCHMRGSIFYPDTLTLYPPRGRDYC